MLLFLLGVAFAGVVVLILWMVDRQRLVTSVARLEAERDAARLAIDEQRASLTRAQSDLRDAFARLSTDALRENSETFLQTAEQTLRARQEAIDAVLGPVRLTLERVQVQLSEVDKSREGSFRAVSQHLSTLAQTQRDLQATTAELSRSSNRTWVTLDARHGIAAPDELARVPSHSATNIEDLSKRRQRRYRANELHFALRPLFPDRSMKELEPLTRIRVG
jgi:DNA recombination protein RmuC